jgi:hypothetical protein
MLATASLAEVNSVSIKDVHESGDEDFILLTEAVIEQVVEAKEAISKEVDRRSRSRGH